MSKIKYFKYIVMGFLFIIVSIWAKIFGIFNSKPIVRVIILHNVESHEINKLELLFERLGRNWDFISPQQFDLYLEGKFIPERQSLLITFDDGFKSSYMNTLLVMDKWCLKAIYFISIEFIQGGLSQAKSFAVNCLKLQEDLVERVDVTPMAVDDVKILLSNGHRLGSHTFSHCRLFGLNSKDYMREIIDSADWLEDVFMPSCYQQGGIDDFAFPFGDSTSIDKSSLTLSMHRYSRVYSGCRGINTPHQGAFIFRDAVSLSEPLFYNDVYLSGVLDFLYRRKFRKIVLM